MGRSNICVKLVSWNVNGLRACAQKGFFESVAALDADVICLQETKMQEDQFDASMPGYQVWFNSAVKKGYRDKIQEGDESIHHKFLYYKIETRPLLPSTRNYNYAYKRGCRMLWLYQ
jgi:hypothetical protein